MRLAGDKPLNKERFLEAATSTLEGDHLVPLITPIVHLLFAAIDSDADGSIQEAEYVRFFQAIGLNEELAKVSFLSLDANHDGVVSLDEYVTAAIEHIRSQVETPTSILMWGPLTPLVET